MRIGNVVIYKNNYHDDGLVCNEMGLMSSSGQWVISNNSAFLSCQEPREARFRIEDVGNIARSEYLLKSPIVRLIDKNEKYSVYHYGWKGEDAYEVVNFIADDGYRVYVEYQINHPDTHIVYRRLDKDFEISYVIHNQNKNKEEIRSTDKKIYEYVKSIIK